MSQVRQMRPSKGAILAGLVTALLVAAVPGHAETHCGLDVRDAPSTKMWEVTPSSERKTTRVLIIATVLAHHRYRACKENGLTVILRMGTGRRVETVYLIKD